MWILGFSAKSMQEILGYPHKKSVDKEQKVRVEGQQLSLVLNL